MAAAMSALAPASSGETACLAGDILGDLNGRPLTAGRLAEALRLDVSAVEVVGGSEKRWPQSHSAKLRLTLVNSAAEGDAASGEERLLYLKKVVARNLPTKTLKALCRDLRSNRTEARFYREFRPELVARGVRLLEAPLVEERLEALDARDGRSDKEQEELLRSGGMLLLLESAEGCMQGSPLDFERASCSLRLLAQLHAAAWGDSALLEKVAQRLNAVAGYWTLEQRGEAEMAGMQDVWANYLAEFALHAPELLQQPGIVRLAERVQRLAPWVAEQLAPSPSHPLATLVHGDYKAMNVFFPSTVTGQLATDAQAIPIDFQWIGVGFGMSDVAMHLSHSVAATTLRDGGEEKLVNLYLETLAQALGASAEVRLEAYRTGEAWRHYHLAVVDYARMVLSVFFKGASAEKFSSVAGNPNVGLVYRDVEASLDFVRRVDRSLQHLETKA